MRPTTVDAAIALGYDLNPNAGICHGLACMGAQAVLRSDAATFANRMEKITNVGFSIATLSPTEKLDLLAFFDGTLCYHNNALRLQKLEPSIDKDIIKNNQKIIDFIFKDDNNSFLIPRYKDEFLSKLTRPQLKALLLRIKSENKDKPFALLLHPPGHVTSIGFDGLNWLAVNHDWVTLQDSNHDIDVLLSRVLTDTYKENDEWIINIETLGNEDLKLVETDDIKLKNTDLKTTKQKIAAMWHYAIKNKTQEIKELIDVVFQAPALSLRDKKSIFSSSQYRYSPSYNFHAEGLKIYMDAVLNEGFSDATKYHLLKRYGESDVPKLHMDFLNGNIEDIAIYTDSIISSSLSPEVKKKLLHSMSAQGFPAISSAFSINSKNCASALALYMRKLFSSDLPISDLEVIISGECNQENTSCLLLGVIALCHNSNHAYVDELFASHLPPEIKTKILCYEWDNRGILFHAIKYKNYSFYKYLIEKTLASDLPELNKLKIICGTTRWYNAHALARKDGMDNLVDEISQKISNHTNLSSAFKKEFMRVSSKQNSWVNFFIPNQEIKLTAAEDSN